MTLGEQLLALAQQGPRLCHAHGGTPSLGDDVVLVGRGPSAHTHFVQGIALYDPQQHRASEFLYGENCWCDMPLVLMPGRRGSWAILTRG